VFVRAGNTPGMKVTGHVEKLAQSTCKRASGDRIWCGTCHDPHVVPVASQRASWYRRKCMTCHAAEACGETKEARAARQDDCTACHMPKNPAADAQHALYTDHSIPRRLRAETPPSPEADLVVFGGAPAEPRDFALAYAILASRTQQPADKRRAIAALAQVGRGAPNDVEVLLYLADLYRVAKQPEKARQLYGRAIQLDPAQTTASVGLGAILMERGQYSEAILLWKDTLVKNAGLEMTRINLALAQRRTGDFRSAEQTLVKAIELEPGFDLPANLLRQLREEMRQAK
jgi:tetratricopeptide (TPR) repeat protein